MLMLSFPRSTFGISLILGDHTLHLNKQCCFRIVVKRRSINVVDLDAMPE